MRDRTVRLDWLQAMRGLAALAVVVTHGRFQLANGPMGAAADRWLKPGESGVDLFFVISGFIMAYALRHDEGGWSSVWTFALRRLIRVWPAYIVCTLLTGWLNDGPALFLDRRHRTVLAKSILFVPGDYQGLYAPAIVVQGWTLNYEIYFYAVLAFSLLWRGWRWVAFGAWFALTLLVIPALAGAASLTSPFLVFVDPPYGAGYMTIVTNPIIWEFLAGVGIGLLFNMGLRFGTPRRAWAAVAMAMAVALPAIFNPAYSHGITHWGWCFALLLLAAALASRDVDFRVPRALVVLGNMSYTLYLTHLIVMTHAPAWAASLGFGAAIPTLPYCIAVVAASVLVAWLCYPVLERALPRLLWAAVSGLRRRPGKSPSKSPGAA